MTPQSETPLTLEYEVAQSDMRRASLLATIKGSFKPSLLIPILVLLAFLWYAVDVMLGGMHISGANVSVLSTLDAIAALVLNYLTSFASVEFYLMRARKAAAQTNPKRGKLELRSNFIRIIPEDGIMTANRYVDKSAVITDKPYGIIIQLKNAGIVRVPLRSLTDSAIRAMALTKLKALKSLGLTTPMLPSPSPSERAVQIDYILGDMDSISKANKPSIINDLGNFLKLLLALFAINCGLNAAINLSTYMHSADISVFIPLLWVAIFNSVLLMSVLNPAVRKRSLAKAYSNLGTISILAAKDGIRWRTSEHNTFASWESVTAISKTEKLIGIALGPAQNLFIPTRLFSSAESVDSFADDLRTLKSGKEILPKEQLFVQSTVWPPPPTLV